MRTPAPRSPSGSSSSTPAASRPRPGPSPSRLPSRRLAARVDDLARVAPVTAPGAAYHYSNANYVVLGRLIEQVSGVDYGTYLRTHVFGPLGMTTATTDHAVAEQEGLTRAHRLWFGIADLRDALDRPDLVSAGFIAASADDMGRYLVAQTGAATDGRAVVSPTSLALMHQGVVATVSATNATAWAGRTARSMASASSRTPGAPPTWPPWPRSCPIRALGVAVLLNGTSPIYELLNKPDTIGLGVVSMLLGREPAGTIQLPYPALDVVCSSRWSSSRGR